MIALVVLKLKFLFKDANVGFIHSNETKIIHQLQQSDFDLLLCVVLETLMDSIILE